MSRVRKLVLVTLILIAALPNVTGLLSSAAAEDLPCYNMWQNCEGSEEYCDGVWCGCMQATYGYSCSTANSGGDYRSIEESMTRVQQ